MTRPPLHYLDLWGAFWGRPEIRDLLALIVQADERKLERIRSVLSLVDRSVAPPDHRGPLFEEPTP